MATQQKAEVTRDALGYLLVWAENGPHGREGEPIGAPDYYKTKAAAKQALADPLGGRRAEDGRKSEAYMRRAVAELQRVHAMSERDAASIMLTVTSVVSLGPKSAKLRKLR